MTLRLAMIGCGGISGQYLAAIDALPQLELVACSDALEERAQAVAAQHPGVRPVQTEAAIAADDVDLVLNLTIPSKHAAITSAAIAAGKHIYGEKPLAVTVSEARAVLAEAAQAGVLVGCAPDTVLGTGIQTARAAIDAGVIGAPIAAVAFMVSPGPDAWHANPDFFYQPGAGPLYDMGPYYLTSLVTLLGPVRRVVALARGNAIDRTIKAGAQVGRTIPVAVDTHVSATLEHTDGALSTVIMSFDVHGRADLPRIEIYGSAGTMSVPDPNTFTGDVRITTAPGAEWSTLPPSAGFTGGARGVGVADLADALASGRPHRASGELALHVLDIMESTVAAAHSGSAVTLSSTVHRPAAVPLTDLTATR